jgi:hypothetical protein
MQQLSKTTSTKPTNISIEEPVTTAAAVVKAVVSKLLLSEI